MRYKFKGYIFLFTLADHEGRHIHVYRGNDLLGVYDRVDGPVRGLEQQRLEDALVVVLAPAP